MPQKLWQKLRKDLSIHLRNHSRKMVKIFAGTRLAHIALYKELQRDKKEARIRSIRENQQEEEDALWSQIKEKIVDKSDLENFKVCPCPFSKIVYCILKQLFRRLFLLAQTKMMKLSI